jgi:Uma2 family endonuclease
MSAPLRTHRFTVDEYHRLGEAGIFHEDDRVELIDGQIVQMSPIGIAHAACVKRLNTLFSPLAAKQVVTPGIQDPLVLAEHDEPQPDVTVLRYRADGYSTRHPGPADTLLVIEVADTSVQYDRSTKIPQYARAAIPEAWLVNLPADGIEVYRTPRDGRYTEVTTVSRGDTLTPLALPGVELSVDEILG